MVICLVGADVEVKKWGNSLGVIIPHTIVKKLHLRDGSKIGLEISSKEKISGFGIAKGASSFKRELEEREF